MEEEFYAAIKLVSGEEIFSLVSYDENDGDPLLILQSPVVMKMMMNNMGTFLKVKPWMEIPDDDFFIIRPDKIITMTEVKDETMIEYYTRYIEEESNVESTSQSMSMSSKDGQVKISNKMGYISSVEDARKKLEDLFKEK